MVNVRYEEILAQRLRKHYSLCKHCFDRQLTYIKKRSVENLDDCYVCCGLMSQLDSIVEKIIDSVEKKYEFNTFLLGASMPSQIYEHEDQIRARFKIRGKESIKKELTKELGIKFIKITKKKVDYLIPDITIKVVIDDQKNADITARAYPIILYGRYIKKCRGLSQKQSKYNKLCGGISGLYGQSSIESIIAKRLISITKGENPKFLWVGSEDQDSLVLGKGRPFFVRISNPRVRKLKRFLKISTDGIYAIINGKSKKIPESPIQFVTKTKILVQSNESLTKNRLAKLKALSNSMVKFRMKSKIVTKKIYSVKVKKINDRHFFLTLIADGGLLIKQFVGGQEYIEPNVSEIIGTRSECIFFDILDVQIQ